MSHSQDVADLAEQARRLELAKSFLETFNSPAQVASIVQGINFRVPVEIEKLQANTPLQRFDRLDQKYEVKPGGPFFSEPGAQLEHLGMVDIVTQRGPPRERDFFIVKREIEVLACQCGDFTQPTHSDFNQAGLLYEGGAKQYIVRPDDFERGALERLVPNSRTLPQDSHENHDRTLQPSRETPPVAPSIESIMRTESKATQEREQEMAQRDLQQAIERKHTR